MRIWRTVSTTLAILGLAAAGCGEVSVIDATTGEGAGGVKDDSGWLAEDSYEVGGLVRGVVRAELSGDWVDVRTDEAAQTRLIDLQIKFIKKSAEAKGWRFNQLADTIEIVASRDDGESVELEYVAVVDMLGRMPRNGWLPTLSDIETEYVATVPQAPTSFTSGEMRACAEVDPDHSIKDKNFHYYFDPSRAECPIALVDIEVEITEVFDRPKAYPEYDQLMQPLDDDTVGFMVALVPNRGDSDPLSRFTAHADMLEGAMGLVGVDAEDGSYRRYVKQRSGVAMVIDLYDPTDVPWTSSFAEHFRTRLGHYTMIHYNGHSSYGTKHLLDEPEAFTDRYQIISMHSCQSYAYYTRQVFRAKETAEDPTGQSLADVMATGKSSYPSGSPPTLEVMLTSLFEGMEAIRSGRPDQAPDWLTIIAEMKNSTWGDILYGMAGVRQNAWHP